MKAHSQNQRLLGAYALMLTLAAGVIALDPVKRHTDSMLADVPIPTQKAFKGSLAEPEAPDAERMARR